MLDLPIDWTCCFKSCYFYEGFHLGCAESVDAEINEVPARSFKVSRNFQGQLFLDGIREAVANLGAVLLGIGDGGIPSHKEGWTNRIFPTTPVKLIVGPKPGVNAMHSSGACVHQTILHNGFCFAICRYCCVHSSLCFLLSYPLQQDTAAWLPYSCASGMCFKCNLHGYRCQAQPIYVTGTMYITDNHVGPFHKDILLQWFSSACNSPPITQKPK